MLSKDVHTKKPKRKLRKRNQLAGKIKPESHKSCFSAIRYLALNHIPRLINALCQKLDLKDGEMAAGGTGGADVPVYLQPSNPCIVHLLFFILHMFFIRDSNYPTFFLYHVYLREKKIQGSGTCGVQFGGATNLRLRPSGMHNHQPSPHMHVVHSNSAWLWQCPARRAGINTFSSSYSNRIGSSLEKTCWNML